VDTLTAEQYSQNTQKHASNNVRVFPLVPAGTLDLTSRRECPCPTWMRCELLWLMLT